MRAPDLQWLTCTLCARSPRWPAVARAGDALVRSRAGMMHEGYFVGRKELTAWINQHFDPNFRKVEDCASGAVYCQVRARARAHASRRRAVG